MARTVDVIKAQIYTAIAAQSILAAIVPNPSQTAIWKDFIHGVAVCIAFFEQLLDQFTADTEETVRKAPPGSEPWLQDKVFQFQYDATTPQLLKLDNFVPVYDPVDTTKRIITRCSVRTAPNRICYVKVAASDPPAALTSPQLTALQSYLSGGGNGTYAGRGRGFGFGGIEYKAQSFAPDYLWLQGTIYYKGQYSAVIQSLVITAIKNYMANIDFNGVVTLLGLTDAIQAVVGVNDIKLTDIAIRANGVSFGSRIYLVQSSTTLLTTYPTYAGYIVEEVTSGEDFGSKLTFTAS